MGVCHPVLQILTLISDHCHFLLWPLKSTPVFRTDINRNYVIITQIRTPAKRFLYKIHFKLALQLLLLKPSYSFGTETTNRFKHSTQFRTKRGKFSDQNGPKTIPYGTVHTYMIKNKLQKLWTKNLLVVNFGSKEREIDEVK